MLRGGLEAGGCVPAQMLSLRDKRGPGPAGLRGYTRGEPTQIPRGDERKGPQGLRFPPHSKGCEDLSAPSCLQPDSLKRQQ